MGFKTHLIPVLNDNYTFILMDEDNGLADVVDPAIASPVNEFLKKHSLKLNRILNTHHHYDHVGANLELKDEHQCEIWGPSYDQERIPGIDKLLKEGDDVSVGGEVGTVLFTPGHTKGHIVYWFKDSAQLFVGDTLFAMGCGRLFEGTPEQMMNSLAKFDEMPDETKVYCAHEYTLTNAQFSIEQDPENKDLIERLKAVEDDRQKNIFTIPTNLGIERKTNPFLRAKSLEEFTKLREIRNNW